MALFLSLVRWVCCFPLCASLLPLLFDCFLISGDPAHLLFFNPYFPLSPGAAGPGIVSLFDFARSCPQGSSGCLKPRAAGFFLSLSSHRNAWSLLSDLFFPSSSVWGSLFFFTHLGLRYCFLTFSPLIERLPSPSLLLSSLFSPVAAFPLVLAFSLRIFFLCESKMRCPSPPFYLSGALDFFPILSFPDSPPRNLFQVFPPGVLAIVNDPFRYLSPFKTFF